MVAAWIASTAHPPPQDDPLQPQLAHAGLRGLTLPDLTAWIVAPRMDGRPPANNSVRQRLSAACTFTAWLVETGYLPGDPITPTISAQLRKSYPKTYGKKQAANPARWLTYDEAYGALLAACQDGTWVGSRDQLAIRLGLLGLRRAEICGLRRGHYQHGVITCTGKANRIREVRPGPTMTCAPRPLAPPVRTQHGPTCRGHRPDRVPNARRPTPPASEAPERTCDGGTPLSRSSLARLITRRAALADLGPVAPHDLRRSAAGILHAALGP